MREILFRAKEKNGDWVWGDFITVTPRSEDLCCIKDHTCLRQSHVCDRNTVGQYTGLTDKKGAKIFEGDILCNERGICYVGCYSAVVKYNNGEFMAEGFVNFYAVDFCVLEVIGNIHDNPELLEGTNGN